MDPCTPGIFLLMGIIVAYVIASHFISVMFFQGFKLQRVTLKLFILSTHGDSSPNGFAMQENTRSFHFSRHCHTRYRNLSFFLLSAQTPLRVEIICIVPIVRQCICCQESLTVHFQCLHRLLVITAAGFFSQCRKACVSH